MNTAVESPAKAKTINRYLGNDYIVESSVGHVRDLPQSAADIPEKLKKEKWTRLGIDVENDFQPLYVVPKDKRDHIRKLKKLAKEQAKFDKQMEAWKAAEAKLLELKLVEARPGTS